MHAGNRYKLEHFLSYTRKEIYVLTILAAVPTTIFQLANIEWLAIPWVPIALIGTAAAFIVGFKNTQSYNRLWEARQIWGAIVNDSRIVGIMTLDFIKAGPSVHKSIILRHLAWVTALRYQLREPRAWEHMKKSYNQEFLKYYKVAEWETKIEDELKKYLSPEELTYILQRKNRATQIIALQSKHLKGLRDQEKISDFEYVEMVRRLSDLYEQQGKCERIKNFPYPRQFASINLFLIWLFVITLPFGMLNEFQKMGEHYVWLTIPFSVIVSWAFTAMERVGEATENPFEGGANDVPITALCRTIEIDLRDMMHETDLPAPLQPVNNILM